MTLLKREWTWRRCSKINIILWHRVSLFQTNLFSNVEAFPYLIHIWYFMLEMHFILISPSAGIYVGEYQKQAWVFVGEITNMHVDPFNGRLGVKWDNNDNSCLYSFQKWATRSHWKDLHQLNQLRVKRSSVRSTRQSHTGWCTGSHQPSCTAEYWTGLLVGKFKT